MISIPSLGDGIYNVVRKHTGNVLMQVEKDNVRCYTYRQSPVHSYSHSHSSYDDGRAVNLSLLYSYVLKIDHTGPNLYQQLLFILFFACILIIVVSILKLQLVRYTAINMVSLN